VLRIAISIEADEAALTLHGRLAGPWAAELERCWKEICLGAPRRIRVELEAVTFIDASGKTLLRKIHEQGGTLVCSGCMTRAIVDEIVA